MRTGACLDLGLGTKLAEDPPHVPDREDGQIVRDARFERKLRAFMLVERRDDIDGEVELLG
jgi:hypothetical protein